MAVYKTAGAKLYIGGTHTEPTSDITSSAFTGETWTLIKNTESLGSTGSSSEAITYATTDTARQQTLKGVRTSGNMDVTVLRDAADAGQAALLAAEKTNSNYAFRLVLADAPEGGTPSERLFIGPVMSVAEPYDQANSLTKLVANIAINSNIVRIEAAD